MLERDCEKRGLIRNWRRVEIERFGCRVSGRLCFAKDGGARCLLVNSVRRQADGRSDGDCLMW